MSKIWEFFENLGEYVYVADAETHELIYMNKNILQQIEGRCGSVL
mgnify:CR=1 FL=1